MIIVQLGPGQGLNLGQFGPKQSTKFEIWFQHHSPPQTFRPVPGSPPASVWAALDTWLLPSYSLQIEQSVYKTAPPVYPNMGAEIYVAYFQICPMLKLELSVFRVVGYRCVNWK